MFRFLPEQASEVAPKIDFIHNLITDVAAFFTIAIVGVMIYFAIRYRARGGKNHPTPQITGSHTLEFIWTVVPTIISIIVAYYGIVYFKELRHVPDDAMTINVTGKQWQWEFQYTDGVKRKVLGEFYVPVGKPVKLVMRSTDVLHSFFIPTMRVKSDVLPNRYTYIAFTPVKTGVYQTFCTEYCGKDHSQMLAKVHVVSQDEYNRWINDDSDVKMKSSMKPEDRGRQIYEQNGCKACHSLDGSRVIGPSWLKTWGHEGELEDGTKYKFDENYVESSIYNPNSQIVKGYPANQMPSFKGVLTQDDIAAVIAFIKTLDGSQPTAAAKPAAAPAVDLEKMKPAERGKYYYETKLCKTCHSIDGSKLVGPSFKGLYGSKQKITGGTEAVADDAYLHESIAAPAAKVVDGYPPAMPPGLLNDKEIADAIEYIKTLK